MRQVLAWAMDHDLPAALRLVAALGWWWLDPVIALVIAAIAVREGHETWTGDGCACAAIPGLDTDGCQDGCC